MASTVDWGTKVITVYQADLAFLGGVSYQLDTAAFKVELREHEASEAGQIHDPILNHNTQVTLGGIDYARIIEIINGYTITFEEKASPYKVYLTGSNNNILDVTNLGTVQIAPNNSAGLINISEVQNIVFNEGIAIDVNNGYAGTTYPTGSLLKPSNNLADAHIIAAARGFDKFYLHSDVVMSAGSHNGHSFIGSNPFYIFTAQTGADLTGCSIELMTVTGELDGLNTLTRCNLSNVTKVSGFVEKCGLVGNLEITGDTAIMECYSMVPANGYPTVTVTSGDLMIRDWHGSVGLASITSGDHSIEVYGGRIVIDNTCTGGNIVLRGAPFEIIDNSAGATVTSQLESDAVWDHPNAASTESIFSDSLVANFVSG